MTSRAGKNAKIKVELILEKCKGIEQESAQQMVFMSWKISRAASGDTKKVPVTKGGVATFNKRITFKTKLRSTSVSNSITLTLRSKVGRSTRTVGRLVFDVGLDLSPKWRLLHFPFQDGNEQQPINFEGRVRIKDDESATVHFETERTATTPATTAANEPSAVTESSAVDLSLDDESFVLSHDDVKRPSPDASTLLRERITVSQRDTPGDQMMRREVNKLRKGEWERQQKMMRAQMMELEAQNRRLEQAFSESQKARETPNSLSLQTLNERLEELQSEAVEHSQLVESLRRQIDDLEEQSSADAKMIQELEEANNELSERLNKSLTTEEELALLLKKASSRPALVASPPVAASKSSPTSDREKSPIKKTAVALPPATKADLAVQVFTFVLLICAVLYTVYKKFL